MSQICVGRAFFKKPGLARVGYFAGMRNNAK